MHTVEISLRPSELSAAMAEMRMWLDERRFEPSVFCCREDGARVFARVDFKITAEATAFANRFGGRVNGSPTPGKPGDHMRSPRFIPPPEGIVG
jgi:hypothetical protein